MFHPKLGNNKSLLAPETSIWHHMRGSNQPAKQEKISRSEKQEILFSGSMALCVENLGKHIHAF